MNAKLAAVSAALALAAPIATAAGNDELWEVTTQMNMAGMPAGMGGTTQQVCSDKDPANQAASRKDMEKCKVTDKKQSGNRFTMTMTCPQGTMVIDQTFNAARTEYKGTMKMTSRDGDMVMNMTGRKLGSCDARQARGERDAKTAAMKAQMDRSQSQAAAAQAKREDAQIRECASAVDTMQMQKLGVYAQCRTNQATCDMLLRTEGTKRAATACMANQAEFCKRYQTMDGFLKAKGDENAAKMCGVSRDRIKTSFCPQAAKTENLAFLGRFCPAEAKPVAQKHCAGRGFTSRVKDKYSDFCSSYLANADLEESSPAARPAPRTSGARKDPEEANTTGVTQGINKLKGLFGK